MATLQDLKARIAKLQTQAEAIAKKESSTVLAKIHDLLEKHGLTTADVDAFGASTGKRRVGTAGTSSTRSGTAKYADPRTGATWTGHGRAPAWIASAKDRSKFLVDGGAAEDSQTTAKKGAKVGNYARGPQPPKYRDPTSGATWSGRGPAPVWLANVEDRTAYLIAGKGGRAAAAGATSANKSSTTSAASKKVAVKKAAVKKTASKKTAATKSVATKGAPIAKKVSAKSAATKKAAAKKPAAKRAVAKKATRKGDVGSQEQAPSQQSGEPSAPVGE